MSRTILEIIQSAAPRLGIDVPESVFGNTDRTQVELGSVANEVAERIAREHDWQTLKILQENVGTGLKDAYGLPVDFFRMPKEGQVWSTRWQRPLIPITTEESLRFDVREYDLVTGTWFIHEDAIKYMPALTDGESAKWYYISSNVIIAADNVKKPRFTRNDDMFRLSDRVLEATLIWEWRQQKGMPYEEEMYTAEKALARAISDDRGARMLAQSSRSHIGGKTAYPWNVGV